MEPYASIIWNILDGDNIWEFVFDMILDKNCSTFDALMREQINKYIHCSKETQTSIISLFMQKKGTNSDVKDFYYKWTGCFMLNIGR